jgi:hypothetical protein
MRERRKNFRVEWNSPAKIYDRRSRFARRCIVSNFSNGGAKIVGVERGTIPTSSSSEFPLTAAPTGAMSYGAQRMPWEWNFPTLRKRLARHHQVDGENWCQQTDAALAPCSVVFESNAA